MTDKLTLSKLKKFIEMRNKSEFHSNLQFSIDCKECGFNGEKELGNAEGIQVPYIPGGYIWYTYYGVLVEINHHLHLFSNRVTDVLDWRKN